MKNKLETDKKPKKINKARIETSGDGTMERHYDESGALFKEVKEDSIDYFYTKGPLKGKLKEREISTPQSSNFYNETGILTKSIFEDERTEHYFGPLKGKTTLKDGTIIDTPTKTLNTPTELIHLGNQATQAILKSASVTTEPMQIVEKEPNSWDEVEASTQGNASNWDEIKRISQERKRGIKEKPKTKKGEKKTLSKEDKVQINIARFKQNKKNYIKDGYSAEKALKIAQEIQKIELLKEKRDILEKNDTSLFQEEKKKQLAEIDSVLKTYNLELEGLLKDKLSSADTQPMPTEEIKELSLADKIIETVPAAYKEATKEEEKAEALKKLREIIENAEKRLAEIDAEEAEEEAEENAEKNLASIITETPEEIQEMIEGVNDEIGLLSKRIRHRKHKINYMTGLFKWIKIKKLEKEIEKLEKLQDKKIEEEEALVQRKNEMLKKKEKEDMKS